jgi:predicted transcriptional regulator
MRSKHTFRLPPKLAGQLADYAIRKGVSQALIVETALASFLSPDGTERLEAAVSRRLDRLSRQNERLEYGVDLATETLALFIRFWLTTTPPLPDSAQAAAQAKGRERYQAFIDALGRKIAKARRLSDEISRDLPAHQDSKLTDSKQPDGKLPD